LKKGPSALSESFHGWALSQGAFLRPVKGKKMTDPMTTQSAGAPSLPELPKPAIPVVYAPAGGFVPTPRSETVTISMPQPYFTADQMNAHYLKGYEAGSAAAAQAVPEGFVLVPREPTFEMNKAGQEAVWDFHPDDTIEGNEETARAAYFAMLAAAPTQGAEGAAPQARACAIQDGRCQSTGACQELGACNPAPQAVVGEAKPQPRWYTGEQES
jgi:hypothetical protein